MIDYEKLGVFYLGKEYDLARQAPTDDLLLYDSKDLTTHAVCVGMTGSGKTGLCLTLLEEAAIDGIPAICIDPKGDLGNLLLTFPDLKAADFQPWLEKADATRRGMTLDELAAKTAQTWKAGLEEWGQSGDRIRRLREAADVAVYTPGSEAGIPLTMLKSFACPPPEIRASGEAFRDRVSATVSGLLGLLKIDADPLRSREQILIATIFDRLWREGKNIDLGTLIREIQAPSFDKVGFLDLESFFPAKDRFALTMSLNNLVASPGFQAWTHGEPLDVQRLFFTKEGKPRLAIVSIAHLSDAERMFFVTILLTEILSWVRTQSGTSSLRALLYMDEIFGFFPPTANPPSKTPMLTLLKQARAYGLGCVLATQNPVDLDYKGLANTGTWFLGRLQTERDKARVLDGLEGASAATGHAFDRAEMDRLLSGLGQRVFLMNNVHEDRPVVFQSRWALSFLRGPLTRDQIESLMAPRKAATDGTAPASGSVWGDVASDSHRVVLPQDVPECFLRRVVSIREGDRLVYRPAVYGEARVHFVQAAGRIDHWQDEFLLLAVGEDGTDFAWDQAETLDEPLEVTGEIDPAATFASLPSPLTRAKKYAELTTALKAFVYQDRRLTLFKSPEYKEVSKPGESDGDFRHRLEQLLRDDRELAKGKLMAKYQPKRAVLIDRLRRAEQALAKQQSQANTSTLSAVVSFGTSILGALGGRKTISQANIGRAASSVRSASRVMEERGDVGRAQETIDAVKEQLQDLDHKFEEELATIAVVDPSGIRLEELSIQPRKADTTIPRVCLLWTPWKLAKDGTATPAW